MTTESCYFWIDKKNLDEQIIVAICKECQLKIQKKDAWFWEHGYGNFDVDCHFCKKLINKFNPES